MNDPFYKKTEDFSFKDTIIHFNLSQDLFSSQSIDKGTQRLLRTFLPRDVTQFNKILDVGCGYGPIGISLKVASPDAVVHMIDRDALAIEYTKQNAALNNIEVTAYGSLGYDAVIDRDFDLIISNIPAKVGDKVLPHLLLASQFHLSKNGLVAIVVVDAILKEVQEILHSNEAIDVLLEKSWPGHTVFHYKFNELNTSKETKDSFEAGLFDRTTVSFTFEGKEFEFITTHNLSEFDTLSYQTELLFDVLDDLQRRPIEKLAVFNPNQGHTAIAGMHHFKPKKILLIDRNLQCLETSKRALIKNGYFENQIEVTYQIDIQLNEPVSSLIAMIPEKERRDYYEMIVDQSDESLVSNGLIFFVSSSTVISILEKSIKLHKKNLKIVKREKRKGESVMIVRKV